MKNYEIIMQYEGEKPILPPIKGVGYKPFPAHTSQDANTEKVFEAETAAKYAVNLAQYISTRKGVTSIRLYGNGELIKTF